MFQELHQKSVECLGEIRVLEGGAGLPQSLLFCWCSTLLSLRAVGTHPSCGTCQALGLSPTLSELPMRQVVHDATPWGTYSLQVPALLSSKKFKSLRDDSVWEVEVDKEKA